MTNIVAAIIIAAFGILLIKKGGLFRIILGLGLLYAAFLAYTNDGLKEVLTERYERIAGALSPVIDTLKTITFQGAPLEEPHAGLRMGPCGISDEKVASILHRMGLCPADTGYYEDRITIIRMHEESLLRGDFPPDEEFDKEYERSGSRRFSIGNTEYARDGQYDRIVYYLDD